MDTRELLARARAASGKGGDASASAVVLPRREPDDTTTASDLTKEAEAIFGPLRVTPEGNYVTNYTECVCGEKYLVKDEHEKSSPRHREWAKGGIEVPVPPQPDLEMFPLDFDKSNIVFGSVVICPRCKGHKTPKTKDHDFYPDPDRRNGIKRCIRCNGFGVVPNRGPIQSIR